jgi:hypothetical protein
MVRGCNGAPEALHVWSAASPKSPTDLVLSRPAPCASAPAPVPSSVTLIAPCAPQQPTTGTAGGCCSMQLGLLRQLGQAVAPLSEKADQPVLRKAVVGTLMMHEQPLGPAHWFAA